MSDVNADLRAQIRALQDQLAQAEAKELGQVFPASAFDPRPFDFLLKPAKPKPRDLYARAERVVESLVSDPELALQVFLKLGGKQFADPWKKTQNDVWARKVHGHGLTACYMKNDGGKGRPNWRMAFMEKKGEFTVIDYTDDVQAGKDALDFLLHNIGWVLL